MFLGQTQDKESESNANDDEIAPHDPDVSQSLYSTLFKTLISTYFYANLMYLIYTIGLVHLNNLNVSLKEENKQYLIYAILHILSAMLYTFSWIGIKRWYDIEVLPDYLNVIGSALWLWSACLYPSNYVTPSYTTIVFYNATTHTNVTTYISNDDGYGYSVVYYRTRRIEVAAAVIEVVCGPLW
jgi:hypothetical protein